MCAVTAEVKSSGTQPVFVMATTGTFEPLWPTKLKEIVKAGMF
jgi:hypothetical protein